MKVSPEGVVSDFDGHVTPEGVHVPKTEVVDVMPGVSIEVEVEAAPEAQAEKISETPVEVADGWSAITIPPLPEVPL